MRILTDHLPHRLGRASAGLLAAPDHAVPTASSFTLRSPLTCQGQPIRRVDPIGVLVNGYPAFVLAVSYQGETSLSFVTDDGLPHLDSLPQRWLEHIPATPPILGS
ncbi:hypothetical protein [Streptomyces sp. NPDC058486]